MRLTFLTVLILTTCNLIFAQTAEYKIRAKNRQIVITNKAKSHALNLGDKIDAAKITDTEILFASRKNGFVYFVLDISGQSKIKSDDRQCGAGIESNFIWLKLDSTWKVQDSNSVRYESCWSPITSDNYRKTNSAMSIEIEDLRENLLTKLSYNANEPERGFQVSQKPLEEPK